MRIAHLVESMGAGVMSAMLSMVEATPDIDHHLVLWPWREHEATDDEGMAFASRRVLPRAPVSAMRALRMEVTVVGADILHAHSSYAGVLARMADPDVDVIYSPHCFAFERTDVGPAHRAVLRAVERALVGRTATLVACSPHEAMLARGLGHEHVVIVPNRALYRPRRNASHGTPPRIVTVGRIGGQKDWRFLLDTKRAFERAEGGRAVWEWIGGGDAIAQARLREAGVEVSGWLPREEVIRRLADAQVYVHTAAWEAAPVSIIEAAGVGLPIAARGIPTLHSLGVPGLRTTPAELAGRIHELRAPRHWALESARSSAFAARHTVLAQAQALGAAYQHLPALLAG